MIIVIVVVLSIEIDLFLFLAIFYSFSVFRCTGAAADQGWELEEVGCA